MDARLLSGYAEVATFPIWGDATTLGKPDRAWGDFKAAMADSTTGVWIILPMVEGRRKQRPPSPVPATGPSEATVLPTALDATEDGGDSIAVLEIAAEVGEETVFVQAASEIDWLQRPAADFARAVHLALAAGAHLFARKLANYGYRLYPHHAELAKMAHILAPPRVVRANLPPDPSVRVNLEWMRAHAAEYRGRWVALKEGMLLASAPTARELRDQLPTTADLFLTRVI